MSLNVFNKQIDLLKSYYKNQHTEAALRYSAVISEIKRRKLENSKILEIGPGSTGITPYLKKEVTGIDINFSGPKSTNLIKVKGKAFELPFAKNSFDVVLSVDVIEHIEPQLREKAISEAIRVAKKLLVIVVPCGEEAEKQDQELQKRWNKIFNYKNQFLDEHVKHGLPKVEEILVYSDRSLRTQNKKAKVHSKPVLNLIVRKIIMNTWISKNKYLYYMYMKGYLPFVPIIKYLNFGKTYRRLFVIEFQV